MKKAAIVGTILLLAGTVIALAAFIANDKSLDIPEDKSVITEVKTISDTYDKIDIETESLDVNIIYTENAKDTSIKIERYEDQNITVDSMENILKITEKKNHKIGLFRDSINFS